VWGLGGAECNLYAEPSKNESVPWPLAQLPLQPPATEMNQKKTQTFLGLLQHDMAHAPVYHPPSCSTKASPGLRTANAGATIVPLLIFACNWQPLPHVTDTRPFNSPFRHSPASEYDEGPGAPLTVSKPWPCRTPLWYLKGWRQTSQREKWLVFCWQAAYMPLCTVEQATATPPPPNMRLTVTVVVPLPCLTPPTHIPALQPTLAAAAAAAPPEFK